MRFWWCAKLCAKARDVEARLKVKIPVEIATTKNLVVFMSFSPFLFVSAYILLYNVIIAKKEGVIMSPEPDEETNFNIKQSITGGIIKILLL